MTPWGTRKKDARAGRSRTSGEWAAWGSLLLALLAAGALTATVLIAQSALRDASDVVVRGEGDALLGIVLRDLEEVVAGPPDDALLQRVLQRRSSSGLTYVAVYPPGGTTPRAEAGDATLAVAPERPGLVAVTGTRARVAAGLRPFRGGPGREGPPPPGARPPGPPPPGAPPWGPPPGPPPPGAPPPPPGAPPPPPFGPPLLVIELDTPIVARLRSDVARTVAVGAGAGVVLLVLAAGLARATRRVSQHERREENERRLVALGRMSSVMAHELRNPLASLKGHAELLVESLEEGKAKTKANRVLSEAQRLELLTRSLLDFVRDAPLDRRPVPTGELVERALSHLAQERVVVDVSNASSALFVDEARIATALANLVQNALQASEEGSVEVFVTAIGDDVVLEVRDHGPGLPEGEGAQIFEPFVTTRVRGTGLGLPLARRAAEQHGGMLTGMTHPEGGAIFRLTLPGAARAA